jgi:hypothetical protein
MYQVFFITSVRATRHAQVLSLHIIVITIYGEQDSLQSFSLCDFSIQSDFVFLRSVRRLLVTATVPSSQILATLMMEAPSSSETLVLTRATWRNIPVDAILHSHRHENLKSYIRCFLIFRISDDKKSAESQ